MIDVRTGKDLKEFPALEEPMIRIYIFLNSAGKIKIGKTKDIQQRYQSLSGSNGAGDKIVKACVSPSSYLYTLERVMHDKFRKYRIPNTEWFYDEGDPTGEKLFNEAVENLRLLFSSASYKRCNKIRREFYESTNKGGDTSDN